MYSRSLWIFFLCSKMGPFHQRQRHRVLWNPKRGSFITRKYQFQFDTSTSTILCSRFFKVGDYNLRLISGPLYRVLYGMLFIVQQQQVAEYHEYSSSTGITHIRGLTRHTSADAAYTDRRSGRVRAHARPALHQEPSLRRRGGKMLWM